MAEGDDESKSFKTTEEATRMSVPVGSDTKKKRKAGIIPDVKYEDPGRSSKTSDSPETSVSPPRKPEGVHKSPIRKKKSKIVVRIHPKPAVVEYQPQEFQPKAFSEPPSVPYPYSLSANKYEWKRCLFHNPLKPAMKPAKDQSPKDDNTLPSILPKAPSRMLPIRSPSLEELAGEVSKMPSKDSRPMPLTQPDPNITQSLPSPEHVSTPQSMKDTASTLPDVPISTKDSASIQLPKLQKDSEASTSPPVQPKDPITLPPILAKDKIPSDREKLSLIESKKSELSKSPPTEPRILPLIPKTSKSSQKPFKKASTLPVPIGMQLPPTVSRYSTERPPTASSNIPLTHSIQLPPIKSSGAMLMTSPKEHGVLPLKAPVGMSLESPVEPSVSPEKPLKVTSKVTIIPMDITREDPEQVSVYMSQQYVNK